MSSKSEPRYSKNVANFKTLVDFCRGLGAAYKPSATAPQLTELEAIAAAANTAADDCGMKRTAFEHACRIRKASFSALLPLSTKAANTLLVPGLSENVANEASLIIRSLRGRRAAKIKTNTGSAPETLFNSNAEYNPLQSAPKNISVSQQDYEYKTGELAALINLITSHAWHCPNKSSIEAGVLQQYIETLTASNKHVVNAYTDWINSRIEMAVILYTPKSGLIDTAISIKKHIKSTFGVGSSQYKQVKSLNFRTYKI